MKNVVITGGTGFIGKRLTLLLQRKGYSVKVLTRNNEKSKESSIYSFWDIEKQIIDVNLIQNAHFIIHLAGEGIADKRWTKKYKIQLIESRIKPLELIYNTLENNKNSVESIISASGVNIYGTLSSSKVFTEEDLPANDFLGEVCVAWENAAKQFVEQKIRTVIVRTGIVLDDSGGALPKMAFLFRFGLGCQLGNGKQYMPWISLNDLCNLYLYAIENNQLAGEYNAVIDDGTTNETFSRFIAEVYRKKIILPAIPAFMLRLFLGKMSDLLLQGSRVDNKKLKQTGFIFYDENLKIVLNRILK
ncbi:MAG: TIGR01777 family protein [Flavobacteriales bacterium]|nr:TIGR01777 family protein [Flavobacteriales bacterium]